MVASIQRYKKARFNSLEGFTLLELLIVLFLLSLGYASLYSAGLGKNKEVDDFQTTKEESREIITFARRLAQAKGSPIAVKITTNKIQLFDDTETTPIPSPLSTKVTPYEVISNFRLSTGTLKLHNTTPVTLFYFDSEGRLSSREKPTDTNLLPLSTVLKITIEETPGTTEELLTISNVTGEIMSILH